jgi:undecaprenyl-diphosphatase
VPTSLTIFAAKYLVFIAVALAAVVLAVRLWPRPRLGLLRWGIAAVVMLVLSLVFAKIGAAVYNDPRPFTTDHIQPLIAHAADNGFPSDHALLAAAVVVLVAMVDLAWSLPFVILAILVDWARVGAGIHHVVDVVGSTLFVALAALIALAVAEAVIRWLTPRLPAGWAKERLLLRRLR